MADTYNNVTEKTSKKCSAMNFSWGAWPYQEVLATDTRRFTDGECSLTVRRFYCSSGLGTPARTIATSQAVSGRGLGRASASRLPSSLLDLAGGVFQFD